MPFTVITNPAVGETLKVNTFGIPVIDNLNFLNDELSASTSTIKNGSFETGTGVDTAPTSWDLVITSGNSTDFETSAANTRHGKQAFSMTTPGGVSGGVTLESTDFFTVSEDYSNRIHFLLKASIATTKITISTRFFDEAESFLSATILYTDSTTIPTDWTEFISEVTPPAGSKLAKIEIVGVDNTTAATCFFDGFEIIASKDTGRSLFTSSGSFVVPNGVSSVKFSLRGAGGAGAAGGGGAGGGGGGGGGFCTAIRTVSPGDSLTVTVASGAAILGPSFTSVNAGPGAPGSGAVPGAGGSATGTSGDDLIIVGSYGFTAIGLSGGNGGTGGGGGGGSKGGVGAVGTTGSIYGGGGGGGSNGLAGGTGGAASVLIEF